MISKLVTGIINYFQHYRIVAYNNRMYKGYKYVGNDLYTKFGAKMWLSENADRTRYVYDLLDVRTGRLVFDFSKMMTDFERVQNIIRKTSPDQMKSVRQMIFNFKRLWTPIVGESGASIYFADLMTIYNEFYKEFITAEHDLPV